MDRKISEEFGEAVLASVREELEGVTSDKIPAEPNARKQRLWHRRDDKSMDEVPRFAPIPVDLWAWPAMEITPVVISREAEDAERGHERGRSRHDSASLHSHESMRNDNTEKSIAGNVVSWIRSSFGGRR